MMPSFSLDQLKNIFYPLIIQITGYPAQNVRKAYQKNSQPSHEIDTQLVYYDIRPRESLIDKQIDSYTEGNPLGSAGLATASYTRVMDVLLTLYGNTAYDMAAYLRVKLLSETPLEKLRQNGIAPVLNNPTPIRAPYEFSGRWWERADLTMSFNVRTDISEAVPYLSSASVQTYY